jgi:glycerol-3-phosphate acyltransferase PlsX
MVPPCAPAAALVANTIATLKAQPMAKSRTIALDCMGGDHGPSVVIPGAQISAKRHPEMRFVLVGDEARIQPELERNTDLAGRARIAHTSTVVAMDDKPSQALRRGRASSMGIALETVRVGEADVAVSAGNTGALMALARLILRPVALIERPAIAAIWPTVESECIVLDVGANIGASAAQLCDYALMGAAMSRALYHIERPSVGLLNVGVEEIKGNEDVKQAHAMLKDMADLPIEYRGFIEGDQIGQGSVDVVVVEGFAGNIALKTAEGTAKQMARYLRDALTRSMWSRMGAFMAQGGFRVLKHKMDPRRSNGGTFLGLNGLAIKSHGGTDALGFAAAIDLGYDMAESGLKDRLAADIKTFHGRVGTAAAS